MKIQTPQDISNKKIVDDGCMVAYTGEIIDLMNPFENNYFIEDIAHGLAYNCRWNGATKQYYSVAEHCIRMHDEASENLKKTALFHDCEEAYWGDMIKPLKNLMPLSVRQAMRNTRFAIFNKYKVHPICEEIEKLDFDNLVWDFDNLILKNNHFAMLPAEAEKQWIRRYNLYTTERISINTKPHNMRTALEQAYDFAIKNMEKVGRRTTILDFDTMLDEIKDFLLLNGSR